MGCWLGLQGTNDGAQVQRISRNNLGANRKLVHGKLCSLCLSHHLPIMQHRDKMPIPECGYIDLVSNPNESVNGRDESLDGIEVSVE